jgi:hypothetical protein
MTTKDKKGGYDIPYFAGAVVAQLFKQLLRLFILLLLFVHSSWHLPLPAGDGAGFVASPVAKLAPAIDRANRTKKIIDSNFFILKPSSF